jgi:tetratricopeptide (TPR) repeat protein
VSRRSSAAPLRHVCSGVLGVLLLCAALRPVYAASPAAEALFDEGRRLLEAGRIDEACAKLAESLAQEVSSGTLLNLALCHETQGKLATAWAEYRAAARLARQQGRTDRAEAAEERASGLEPKLPRLTLTAPQPAFGLKVFIDGIAIGEGALGVPVPIDSGPHRVTASAPGHLTWTAEVPIAEAEQHELAIPALEPEPAPVAVAPAPSVPLPPRPRRHPPAAAAATTTAAPQPSSSRAATVGWIVGGAGIVGVGVGTVFGLRSLASYDEAKGHCPNLLMCNDAAIEARVAAEREAWVANVALGVGLLAVGTGAYLILSSRSQPKREKLTLRATPSTRGGWVSLSSAF